MKDWCGKMKTIKTKIGKLLKIIKKHFCIEKIKAIFIKSIIPDVFFWFLSLILSAAPVVIRHESIPSLLCDLNFAYAFLSVGSVLDIQILIAIPLQIKSLFSTVLIVGSCAYNLFFLILYNYAMTLDYNFLNYLLKLLKFGNAEIINFNVIIVSVIISSICIFYHICSIIKDES